MGGSMGYKLFKIGWLGITILCLLISSCIPIYVYLTDQVPQFHYGIVLFITMVFTIVSTYMAHRYDKQNVQVYKYLAIILSVLLVIVTLILLSFMEHDVMMNHFSFYDATMLLIGIISYLMAFYYANKIESSKAKIISMLIAAVVATLAWTLFSYMSYYSGVRSVLYQNQMSLFHATKAVIVSEFPSESKLQKINDIANTTGGELTIYKDGQLFYNKKSNRDTKIYNLERIYSKFEKEEFRRFQYEGSDYELEYKYANQPYYWWGIVRAITFSIWPDIAYGYSLNGYTYYTAQKYARSTQFWGVFWVFYCIALVWQFYRLKDEQNNHRLQIAYSAYDHMHDEFDKIALRDTKQELQKIQLSWSEIVDNILADSRHSLKNKLQDQPLLTEEKRKRFNDYEREFLGYIEKRMNEQLSAFRDTILEHQKELFKTLDYKLKKEQIGTIIEYINGKIPKNYRDKRRSGISFTTADGIDALQKMEQCLVNLNRVFSIVENILKNSSNALANRSIDDDFEDRITLSYEIEERKCGRYFAIRVTDNAGGFQKHILDKIYKEPVESSDRTVPVPRMGKGSQYVKFFSDRMNAQIIVINTINEFGEVGAKVTLLIPIVEGEKCDER